MTPARSHRRRRACALFALSLLGRGLAARDAAASPELDFGFGARSQALGGAGVAIADDATAVLQNPSGLVRAEHVGTLFGYAAVDYALNDHGRDAGLPLVHALEAGLVVPGAIHGLPVAFGLSLALPDGRLSRLREADPSVPYWPLDDASPRLVDLGTGFAVRPLPELALGAGLGFVASLHGTFGVSGNAVAADGHGSEYGSNLRHAVDADLTASRFPLVGAGFFPSDALAVGLSYRGAALLEHRIEATLDGTLEIGDGTLPVHYAYRSRSSVAYLPPQVALGASYRLAPGWLATAELDWQHYAPYRAPYAETSSHVAIPPGYGITIPDTVAVAVPKARLHDRFVPRLGIEPVLPLAPALELALRAGYAFEPSPLPKSQSATRFLDLDRHLVTAGAGLAWAPMLGPFETVRLDASFADALGVPRAITTTAGVHADRASGHVLLLGASLGVTFRGGEH